MRIACIVPVTILLVALVACEEERPLQPPPSPEMETVPPPKEGQSWERGHWEWRHGQWGWVEGQWRKRPGPDARWVDGHYERARDGSFVWIPGRWLE